jgi:uncharacterized protein with HEPN domain
LLVIGEAATRLRDEHPQFIAAHMDIPWPAMRRMRNRIAHGYFDVDLTIVWDTVKLDLPTLQSQIRTALDTMNEKS